MLVLSRLREISFNDKEIVSYSLSITKREGEERKKEEREEEERKRSFDNIQLEQLKVGDMEYLLLTLGGESAEQLENLYQNNRFFKTALITARAKQLETTGMGYEPYFKTTPFAVQDPIGYVNYELDHLTKKFEDGKIFFIKDGQEEKKEKKNVIIESKFSPGPSPPKKSSGGGRGRKVLERR